jgi:hypothetical protein
VRVDRRNHDLMDILCQSQWRPLAHSRSTIASGIGCASRADRHADLAKPLCRSTALPSTLA